MSEKRITKSIIPDPLLDWHDSYDALNVYESETSFELWWIDADLDNGYTISLLYFWRLNFPFVTINIYAPDGTRIINSMEQRELNECRASREKCDLVFGKDTLRQDGNNYKLSLHTKEAGAELTFCRKLPPCRWPVYYDGLSFDNSKLKQCNVMSVPRSDLKGKLWIGDKEMDVSGQGFQDHDWGDIGFHTTIGGFFWGRVYYKEFTFVYPSILPITGSGEDAKTMLYVAKGEQIVLVSDRLKPILSDYEVNKDTGINIPNRITFEIKEGDVEVSVCFTADKLLQLDIDEIPNSDLCQHCYRRIGKFTGTIIINGETHIISSADVINAYVLFVPKN